MNIRRFNETGLARFASWLDELRAQPTLHVPREMLEDDALTECLGVEIAIEPQEFPRRFEAAQYLHSLLHGRGLHEPERDAGLWAWLTLFFFEQVCPAGAGGKRKVGEHARLFPLVQRYDRYYRHLLLGPYVLYSAHATEPGRAMCVLANPLDKPGEVVAQVASRKFMATSAAIVRACTTLYVLDGAYKRGSQTGGSKNGQGGSPRRLADWGMQIDRTIDLGSTVGSSLIAILPREFAKWSK